MSCELKFKEPDRPDVSKRELAEGLRPRLGAKEDAD
jgi:hypothetical protein